MMISSRLDMENPKIIEWIVYGYATSMVVQLGILWWIYTRISSKNDRTPLTYIEPENKWTETCVSVSRVSAQPNLRDKETNAADRPAKTFNLTNYEYDVSQLGALMRQSLLSVTITLALFFRGGYVRPLFLQSLLPVKTLLAAPLFSIHGRGKSAVGNLKRPFVTPNPFAMNPGAPPPVAVSQKELKRAAKKEAKTK